MTALRYFRVVDFGCDPERHAASVIIFVSELGHGVMPVTSGISRICRGLSPYSDKLTMSLT
jgi:hypothetical protein